MKRGRKASIDSFKNRRNRILDRELCVINCGDCEIKGGEAFMLDDITIQKAIDGEPDALASVIKFYEPVINRYAKRKQYNSHGGYKYEIDNDVKKSLELLLIVAVMSYKIR